MLSIYCLTPNKVIEGEEGEVFEGSDVEGERGSGRVGGWYGLLEL